MTNVDGSHTLTGVSCTTTPTTLCVASDANGNVVTSTNPTGGAAAWTVADADSSNALYGISCPTAGLCVSVDSNGSVVTSSNPTGGASKWISEDADPGNFFSSVSCSSATLCVAADDEGNVVTSTNPTGGPSAWKVAPVDGSASVPELSGVSCTAVPEKLVHRN